MYLDEINNTNTGFDVYLDLDGVLVDWAAGAEQLIGEHWLGHDKKQDAIFWKTLHNMELNDVEDYWATLPWISGGKALWKYLQGHRPTILSKPDNRPGFHKACERGKARWVKTNLGVSNYIFTTEKWRYAKPNAILIDDTAKNNIQFEDHGGISILYNGNPKDVIEELQHRFNFPKR